MDLEEQAAGIGALADENRRRLYEYVVAQPDPVSRDQAAAALELPPHRAYFHLDRLVAEGLLEVEYRRLSGRSGPGAGRPSKLYRRADRQFSVSLPERRYDLVGDILATAVTRAPEGNDLDGELARSAHEQGVETGRNTAVEGAEPLSAVAEALSVHGYESRIVEDTVVLANCPFDSLARKHTNLVCGLNRSFVEGVTEGVGCADSVRAVLEPEPGQCCVKARLVQPRVGAPARRVGT